MSVIADVPLPEVTDHLDNWTEAMASGATWHLLYVKSRQEKLLADDLSAMGVAHFLPLATHARRYGKRNAAVELPLFPGYVFVLGSLDEAYRADRTGRVVQIIRVSDQKTLAWELTNLRHALTKNRNLSPYPFLKQGMRVEVKSGPLCGLQGVIENYSRANRLILQVDMLAKAVSLEIDGAVLDPL